MKIFEYFYAYKCGHEWRVLYPKGATVKQVKKEEKIYKNKLCTKCEKEVQK